MLGFECLSAGNREDKDLPVQYWVGDPYKIADRPFFELSFLLGSGACKPEDIFVLAPSIKGGTLQNTTPVQKLANKLVEQKVPVYASISDKEKLSDDVIRGKVCVTTFHSSKGRKVVCIFSFNLDYFVYSGGRGEVREYARTRCM